VKLDIPCVAPEKLNVFSTLLSMDARRRSFALGAFLRGSLVLTS
jgi:hypothetical protein